MTGSARRSRRCLASPSLTGMRWQRYIWLGVLLGVVGIVALDAARLLGFIVLVIAGCLFLAGLVGGAVDRDTRDR